MSSESVALGDQRHFKFISGLWTGDRGPLEQAAVLRSTNFRGDGFFDYSDIAELQVRTDQLSTRRLERGDIVIERSGGGPKQPVGRVAVFDPPDDRTYATSNFTIALRVVDRSAFEPHFVNFFLHSLYLSGDTESLQRATTGIRNLDWAEYQAFTVPKLPLAEQRSIAKLLLQAYRGTIINDRQLEILADLKRAAMRALFTKGLRGEAQKDTEIGSVPESWDVVPLGKHYSAASGGTPSRTIPEFWQGGTIPWVKTTEVNYSVIVSTEEHITEAGLQGSAAKWLKAGTLLIAMYGQGVTRGRVAILGIDATCNQACAALNPLDERITPLFLFHFLSWRYEAIRQLAHGGQQQNLNLDIIRDLPIAYPPTLEEQNEIVAVLDAIDRKIDLHKRKRAVLEELFRSLLHKLMTGEIRVADLDLSALDANAPEGAAA